MRRVLEAHDYVKPNRLDDVEPKKPCGAIACAGVACEGKKGHSGPHFVTFTWSDD